MYLPLAVEPLPPPVAVPAGVFLGGILMFLLCFTFDRLWRATLGPILVRIGKVGFGGIRGHLQAHPFGFLVSFNDDMERWLKAGEALGERYAVNAFGTILWFFYNMTFTVVKAVYDLNTAIDNVWHEATTATTKVIRETIVKPVQKAAKFDASKLTTRIDHLVARVDHLAARVAHTATATAGAIAAPFPRIGHLERDVANANKWLRKHRYLAKYATLSALGAAILAKLGASFIRCTRVKKAGNRVCGMDAGLLDALLTGTLLIAGTISLVEFAEEVQSITDEASGLIHGFLREA